MAKYRKETDPELIIARDRATAESWPLNDSRANYPRAADFRAGRAEGVALGAERAAQRDAA